MDLHALLQVEAPTEAEVLAAPPGPLVVAALPLQGVVRQTAEISAAILTQMCRPLIMVSVVGIWRPPQCALYPLLIPPVLHIKKTTTLWSEHVKVPLYVATLPLDVAKQHAGTNDLQAILNPQIKYL